MKSRTLSIEHYNLMNYSRELLELKIPVEINYFYYTIAGFILFIISALFMFKIDNVIKVPGIVKTMDNTSEISNVISGKITSINYKPNQYVNKGDILFTIDDSQYKASVAMYKKEIENIKKELLCYQFLIQAINTEKYIEIEDSYIQTKIKDYLKTVSLMRSQNSIYKYQYEYQKNLPPSIFNSKTTEEMELQYKLNQKQLEKFILDSKVAAMENEKTLSLKLENLCQELLKLETNCDYINIKAPISGYIQEVSSLNEGDYVFSNQKVLRIIPINHNDFKIELYIPTKDIGEVTEGSVVKYRLSAFPFYEYKGAEGKLQIIDPDIRQSNDKLYYCAYSDINKTSFTKNDGKIYPLRTGIEVDARIVLEKITIGSFILRKMGITL